MTEKKPRRLIDIFFRNENVTKIGFVDDYRDPMIRKQKNFPPKNFTSFYSKLYEFLIRLKSPTKQGWGNYNQ